MSVTLVMPASRRGRRVRGGKHPKAVLVASGTRLRLPYAPNSVQHTGWGRRWSELTRPGRRSLLVEDGAGLAGMSFTALFGHADNQESVEPLIATLRRLAEGREPVHLRGMGRFEDRAWRITEVVIDSKARQQGTNAITRADVTITLTEASDHRQRRGPLTGGKGGKGRGEQRRHKVQTGDTLRKLANRYYGEPDRWRLIAKANDIKDPGKPLKPGTVLKIPARDDKGR